MSTLTQARALRVPRGTDERLRIAIIVLAVIGIGIGAYLTYVHYAGLKVACLASGGCETVQSSSGPSSMASRWRPSASSATSVIFGSVWVRGEIARMTAFGVALIGFLFSMYLTYREGFSIHAWCEWCVTSAVIMTLLMILTAVRALRTDLATAPT